MEFSSISLLDFIYQSVPNTEFEFGQQYNVVSFSKAMNIVSDTAWGKGGCLGAYYKHTPPPVVFKGNVLVNQHLE